MLANAGFRIQNFWQEKKAWAGKELKNLADKCMKQPHIHMFHDNKKSEIKEEKKPTAYYE